MTSLLLNITGHINNLYNTVFWAMVQQGGMATTQAEEQLKVDKICHIQSMTVEVELSECRRREL